RATSGQALAEPTIALMKSRRRIASPRGLRSAPIVTYRDAITAGIYDRRNGVQGSVCAGCGREGRYSITSSARVRIVGEMERPIDFAVLRLMTNSNSVGSSTGSWSGFVPLRVLSM